MNKIKGTINKAKYDISTLRMSKQLCIQVEINLLLQNQSLSYKTKG